MTGDASAVNWHDVYADADLSTGELVNVNIGRHSIVLVRNDDGVSALQNVCPHEKCYLHTGVIDDGVIVCPGHGWRFDAHTGAGIKPRNANLGCYGVDVRDGRILIALKAR